MLLSLSLQKCSACSGSCPLLGGSRPNILKFQTYYISSIIGQKASYTPPLEIPKVWWPYISVLCGYRPPYVSTFCHRGTECRSNMAPKRADMAPTLLAIRRNSYYLSPNTIYLLQIFSQHGDNGHYDGREALRINTCYYVNK